MIERVAYRPLRNAPKLAPLITAVGISFILQNVGILWLGGSQKGIPDLIDAQKRADRHRRRDHLAAPTCWRSAVTIPLVFLLTAFITRSRLGKAMRATAQDPEAARLMGINVDTTISLTFLLGGLLAGAAGLIYALYQTQVWFFQGFTAGLIAFTAAVMGGIGNLRGAVLGGLIIGCIQQISDNRIGNEWTPAVVFAYLVLIMVFRPAGPDRRGDEGGRMSELARAPPEQVGQLAARGRRRWSRWRCSRSSAPPLDSFMDDTILALAYVVMALGLNIVVGFAGLLDLGYVAFYAFGALTVGWFASDHFTGHRRRGGHPHRRQRVRRRACPGIHLNFLLIVIGGDHRRAPSRERSSACRRCACAATTSRSSRWPSARSSAASRQNGDEITIVGLRALQRPPVDLADRPDRPPVLRRVRPGHQPQTVLLDRARAWCWSCCS